eukprot:scaffold11116_cov18-Tisochrysis_lutea.AAC.1
MPRMQGLGTSSITLLCMCAATGNAVKALGAMYFALHQKHKQHLCQHPHLHHAMCAGPGEGCDCAVVRALQ